MSAKKLISRVAEGFGGVYHEYYARPNPVSEAAEPIPKSGSVPKELTALAKKYNAFETEKDGGMFIASFKELKPAKSFAKEAGRVKGNFTDNPCWVDTIGMPKDHDAYVVFVAFGPGL